MIGLMLFQVGPRRGSGFIDFEAKIWRRENLRNPVASPQRFTDAESQISATAQPDAERKSKARTAGTGENPS
ncbi:MAG TPA: hypothetical protein VN428_18280 [Bryobacteraceae bacterium]|nr:hypothetical protein [Bryobacteraceae bacterium]